MRHIKLLIHMEIFGFLPAKKVNFVGQVVID